MNELIVLLIFIALTKYPIYLLCGVFAYHFICPKQEYQCLPDEEKSLFISNLKTHNWFEHTAVCIFFVPFMLIALFIMKIWGLIFSIIVFVISMAFIVIYKNLLEFEKTEKRKEEEALQEQKKKDAILEQKKEKKQKQIMRRLSFVQEMEKAEWLSEAHSFDKSKNLLDLLKKRYPEFSGEIEERKKRVMEAQTQHFKENMRDKFPRS